MCTVESYTYTVYSTLYTVYSTVETADLYQIYTRYCMKLHMRDKEKNSNLFLDRALLNCCTLLFRKFNTKLGGGGERHVNGLTLKY